MAEPCPQTAELAAAQAGVPLRTWQRWLERWFELGVAGVERVRDGRARGGLRYRVAPDFVERWRRGEIPSPHRAQLAA